MLYGLDLEFFLQAGILYFEEPVSALQLGSMTLISEFGVVETCMRIERFNYRAIKRFLDPAQ